MDLASTSILLHADHFEAHELRQFATTAEAAGFHAAWTVDVDADSSVFNHEVLAHTTGLVTGSCVASRWKRHPMLMAQNAASLNQLYPGRIRIGIGSAVWMTHPRASWGSPLDRAVGRMSEFLDILGHALAGEDVDMEGKFYVAQGKIAFPSRDQVRIYVAAAGPQIASIAGRKADGVFCHVGTSARIGAIAATARAAAERAGRDPDALRVDQVVFACVAESRDVAAYRLRRVMTRVLSDGQLSEAVTELQSAEAAATIVALRNAGQLEAAAAALPDLVVHQMGVALVRTDSADELRTALAKVRAPGVTALTLYPLPVDDGDFATPCAALLDTFHDVRAADQSTH